VFSVDISQSNPAPPVRLSGFLEPGRSVANYILAPDGSGLAYTADQRADEKVELFYVDLRKGVVNGELGPESDIFGPVNETEIAFSPDGKKLAYAADQVENDRVEVFVADVATGTPKTALRVQEAQNPAALVYRLRFAPDGRSLVYASDAFDHGIDFWVADVAGGTPGPAHRLNDGPGTVSANPYFVLTK
jgi:Tol biopolymer transport system component